MGLEGQKTEGGERCNGKAWTNLSGLKLCWAGLTPLLLGFRSPGSLGNILQTYFASFSSGAVGTTSLAEPAEIPTSKAILCTWV